MSEIAGAVAGAVEGVAPPADGVVVPPAGGAAPEGGAADRWQDKFLPEDMRANETLGRYKDIPSLAKGLVEMQQFARGRIAVPAADATDEQWGEFIGKVRPEKADAYDIPVPEGSGTDMADAARAKFHELGLHPRQAKGAAEWFNQKVADDMSRLAQGNKDALTAIELEMGTAAYNQRLAAVGNMMTALGFEDYEAIDALEHSFSKGGQPGADKALKLLFALAENTGELAKVDGAQVQVRTGNLTPQQASDRLDAMQRDPEMRQKYGKPGTPENKLYNDLIAIQAKGA